MSEPLGIQSMSALMRESWFADGRATGLSDDVSETIGGIKSTAVDTEGMVISNSVTSRGFTPMWMGSEDSGDVTYPQFLVSQKYLLDGDTGPASTGTAHTHRSSELSSGWANTSSYFALADGTSVGGAIRASESVIRNRLRVFGRREAGTMTGPVYIDVFEMDDSENLRRVLRTADVGPLLQTTYGYIVFDLGEGILTSRGRNYIVAINNKSGIKFWVSGTDTGTYPMGWSRTTGDQLTYTEAEWSYNQQVRWMCLYTDDSDAPDYLSYKDDFNRFSVGSQWLRKSNSSFGKSDLSFGTMGYGGIFTGTQASIYTKSLNYDSMRVEAVLNTPTSQRTGLILKSNSDMTSLVCLGINSTDAVVYTGAWNSLTARSTITTDTDLGRWAAEYLVSDNSVHVYKDDVEVGTPWADTGSVIKHGSDQRLCGTSFVRGSVSSVAASLDNWTCRDVG